MTLPVPNMNSALVNKLGMLIPPWNTWFSQFSRDAPQAQLLAGASPLSFNATAPGNLIVLGGTISDITLTRGIAAFNLTGEKIIPMGIGDIVTITFSVAPTINFLGA